MKITKLKLKQLLKEELDTLEETDWDVSKRTAMPRVISQILSALREAQNIIDGGHLDEEEPVSDTTIEKIKEVFDHPMLDKLKELAGIAELDEPEDEDEDEASLRRVYDREESEAKRNPKPPMSPEKHKEYMSLYDDDE
tara:strand:+ start:3746 stop:4162 length:417 start_codon:yes stop_codon:yes gene_type:complete